MTACRFQLSSRADWGDEFWGSWQGEKIIKSKHPEIANRRIASGTKTIVRYTVLYLISF